MNKMKKAVEASAISSLEKTEGGLLCRSFRFGEEFLGFSGHFPGYPIVPAIVQILAAQAMIEEGHGSALRLLAVENAKFLIQLRPDREIGVSCQPRPTSPGMAYQVKLTAGDDLAASCTLRFEEVESTR